MRMYSFSTLAALAVGGLIFAGAVPGDETAPASTITETIGVEVINVDVVVTDKKGRPITGLERDDFELTVDGRPVPVSNFFEVRQTDAPAGEPRSTRPRLTIESAVNVEPAKIRPNLETPHVVVLVDHNYLSPAGRRRMLEQLPSFIERQIASGARVMTVVHDQTPRVLRPFDAGVDEHVAALRGLGKGSVEGLERIRSWRDFVDNVNDVYETCLQGANQFEDQSPCAFCTADFINVSRIYAQNTYYQRQRTLDGLEAVVSVLRGVPGRKVLLYVGDGFPRQPGIEAYYYLQDLCPEIAQTFQGDLNDRSGAGPMHPLVAHANTNQVTIYSLESAGLEGFSSASVDRAGPSSASRPSLSLSRTAGANVNELTGPSATTDQIRISNRQGGLFYIANETGGRAILNLNDAMPELAKLGDELGHYYSLGFTLTEAIDDRIRRVGVRLPGHRNAQLRYRRSFRYKPREELVAERTLSAQLIGVESNDLDARVVIGIPTAGDENQFRVPIDVFIPLDRLVLQPGEALEEGRLAVIISTSEGKGQRTRVRKQEVGVALPDGAEGYCRLGFEIELGAGEHLLGLGLWDQVSDQRSFLRVPVTVDPSKTLPAVASAGAGG